MLGIAPATSLQAVADLDAVERRIGRELPASVREWYSLDGACDLLLRYSNNDRPLPIAELGMPRVDTHGHGPHDLLNKDLVVFRYENQAVCVWAFKLDGTDDPPVYVDFDSQFSKWTRCAPNFSAHLYAWMWDYALVLGATNDCDLLIQAQNEPLSQDTLAFLRKHLDVGPETWGGFTHTQHRFSQGDQRLLLWAGDDQRDWWLSADDEESLKELIVRVRDCDGVERNLWSNTDRGEKLLREMRRS